MESFFEDINRATPEYPCISISHHDTDYVNHLHEETEIVFVIDGSIDISLDTERITVSKGDICIITPGRIHNFIVTGKNTVCVMKIYSFVDLTGIRLKSSILERGNNAYVYIKKCIDTIISEDKNRREGYKSAVNIASWQAELYILREFSYERINSDEIKKLNKKVKLIDDINTYLSTDFAENVTLDSVARYCGYTKYYFSHFFKSTAGMGFWQYYSFFRIKKAAFMLDNSSNSVTQIAADCGFSTLRSFNRTFKNYYGCSPRDYRKNR